MAQSLNKYNRKHAGKLVNFQQLKTLRHANKKRDNTHTSLCVVPKSQVFKTLKVLLCLALSTQRLPSQPSAWGLPHTFFLGRMPQQYLTRNICEVKCLPRYAIWGQCKTY
ncbi:unnamed protein product [Ixodes persulcatus]